MVPPFTRPCSPAAMTHCDTGADRVRARGLLHSCSALWYSRALMVRLRRVPVLVSTLALVAGCASADRVELSGVVRDGRTGSPLVGARVTGADGVATHTDAEGRFTLSVMRGLRTQLRVSAEGHADAVQSLGMEALDVPPTLAFELEPLVVEEEEETIDPHAVVRWSTAQWVAERFSRGHAEAQWEDRLGPDASWIDGGTSRDHAPADPPSCPAMLDSVDTPDDRDVPLEVGGSPAPWLGSGSRCVSCHRDGIAGFEANVVVSGAHARLGDSCLSCHDDDGAADASACARCHAGDGVGGETNRGWHVELETGVARRATYDVVLARAREAMARRVGDPRELTRWIEVLARDPSHGAHDPRSLAELDAATH